MTKILEKENENNSLDLHFREEKLENDFKKKILSNKRGIRNENLRRK